MQTMQSSVAVLPRRKKGPPLPAVVLAVLCLLCVIAALLFAFKKPAGNTPARPNNGEWPAQVGDRLVDDQPLRIVSLSPMITDALLNLPGGQILCGVTEYCETSGREIATVGTPLLPRTDEILQLTPDYVLCQTPVTEAIKTQLEAGGARIVTLQTPTNLETLRSFYGDLGAVLKGGETGRAFGYGVIDRLSATLNQCAGVTGQNTSALLLLDLSGLAATPDSAEWDLLGSVFRHPLPDSTGWLAESDCLTDDDPENDLDAIIAADPDILFVPDTVSPEELSETLGALGAVQKGAVVYYNIHWAETLSPRIVFAVADGLGLL